MILHMGFLLHLAEEARSGPLHRRVACYQLSCFFRENIVDLSLYPSWSYGDIVFVFFFFFARQPRPQCYRRVGLFFFFYDCSISNHTRPSTS